MLARREFLKGLAALMTFPHAGAGFGNPGVFSKLVVIISKPGQGLFMYSPNVGPGNLVASIAPTSGTDGHTNAYLPGFVAYKSGATYIACQVNAGNMSFYTAPGASGPWTLGPNIFSTGANLNLQAAVAGTINVIQQLIAQAGIDITSGGLTVVGGENVDTLTVSNQINAPLLIEGSIANNKLLTIQNVLGGGTNAAVQIQLAAFGDSWFGMQNAQVGTNNMWLFDTVNITGVARLRAGPGNTTPDTAILRITGGQWTVDPLIFNNGGASETWQTPTFAGTFANAASPGVPLQYKRTALFKEVHWVGRITNTVGQLTGQPITAAVPAAYRPGNTHDIVAYNITQNTVARISIGSTGILTLQSAMNANDLIGFEATIGLDA